MSTTKSPYIDERDEDEFLKNLEEELGSCCLPAIKDPANASTDEVIRDMYRVLTGNGGPTKGVVFKVASTNVNVKTLKHEVRRVGIGLAEQVEKCDKINASVAARAKLAKANATTIDKIWKAIWDNKSMLFVLILSALVYFNNKVSTPAVQPMITPQQLQTLIEKVLDTRLQDMSLTKADMIKEQCKLR